MTTVQEKLEFEGLHRRVAALEYFLGLGDRELVIRRNLMETYLQAAQLQTPGPKDLLFWNVFIPGLTEAHIGVLAELSGDPWCWRRFMVVLDILSFAGFDVSGATAHLQGVVQNVLRHQGLGILRPEDLWFTPSAQIKALDAYKTRT